MTLVLLSVGIRFVAAVAALQLLLSVAGTNLYEIQSTRRKRDYAAHPHARRLRRSPLVSVVVVARDNESTIAACLASIMRSTYRTFEVIVVDNNSSDKTRRVVRTFQAGQPKRPVRLFAKRRTAERFEAVRAGFRRHANGEIVLVLSADQTVDRRALNQAVKRFNADPDLQVLTPQVRTASAYSGLGVLQKYRELVGYRSLKWNSALGSEYALRPEVACRREQLIRGSGNRRPKSEFADDVRIYAAAPATLDELAASVYASSAARVAALIASRAWQLRLNSLHDLFVGCFRLPLAAFSGLAAVCLPFVLGYVGYLAVGLHEPTFLLCIAAVVSLLLLFAIWDDQQLKVRQKLAYTLGIPLTFGPLAALSVVQAAAVVGGGLTLTKRTSI